ncbi:phage tail fiber domain-containing protein [Xylophilus sp.]|uniref:phage tail fiber domain-containing protein n=1 Tax=Xylophilus sp. TaxID=2653893 RepID=UPI0013BD7BA2|nr:phage tail fiber protein [Xylophilus sp.]KAF1049323.1 MAG: hypothetical protein GAK38_00779 [Xylophilus sp.]
MTTTYQPWNDYTADGATKRYTFGFPYLSRSHIVVTRNAGAPALFKFIDDHTVEVHTLFGEPIPAGEPLKIFRATPDLDAFADFKDAALMTATDLNRARLQVLYLVQERSGGLTGSVSTVITNLTSEIETISGALDSLAYSQAILTAGLRTLDELGARAVALESGQKAIQELVDKTIADVQAANGAVVTRLDTVEAQQANLSASVNQSIATLVSADLAFSSRLDSVKAELDALGDPDTDDREVERIAASILGSAVAEATSTYTQARQLETLEARFKDVDALIEQESKVRSDADGALAKDILTLQTQIGENLGQIIQDLETSIDRVGDRVVKVESQYSLKTMAQRADGKQVFAGIGLNATASDDYTGSEIVLAAQRLVFVDSAAPNGTLQPMFVAGSVDGSPTFVVPSNRVGDKTFPGRVLVDGAVEARSIAADAVTTDKLKAGAVTIGKLDVSLGTNLLKSSTFLDGLSGWTYSDNLGGITTSVNGAGATWKPEAMDAASMFQGNQNYNGQDIASRFSELTSANFPVIGGERYEFSCYTGLHRAVGRILLVFVDAAGNAVGVFNSVEDNAAAATGGALLSNWKRLYGFGVAPTAAASARLLIRKGPTQAGQSDSWLFATMPFVAVAGPNQTRPSPWTTSGLGTTITPAGITTPSLSALSANIGTATAGRLQNAANTTWIDLSASSLSFGGDLTYDPANGLRVNKLAVIDTAQIAGNALSKTSSATSASGTATLALGLTEQSTVICMGSVDSPSPHQDWAAGTSTIALSVNGVQQSTGSGIGSGCSTMACVTLPAGTHTVTGSRAGSVGTVSLATIQFKR